MLYITSTKDPYSKFWPSYKVICQRCHFFTFALRGRTFNLRHTNPITMGRNMYKVWNSTRTLKKSLVASSLKELRTKGSEKLGYDEPMTVVLEEDGTIVEDEDYFELLEANTTFILLTDGETWKPVWETASGEDTVDHSIASETPRIEQLASILRAKPSMLVTFNKQDLQEIVDTNTSHLTSLLGGKHNMSKTTSIQDACQLNLLRRTVGGWRMNGWDWFIWWRSPHKGRIEEMGRGLLGQRGQN